MEISISVDNNVICVNFDINTVSDIGESYTKFLKKIRTGHYLCRVGEWGGGGNILIDENFAMPSLLRSKNGK